MKQIRQITRRPRGAGQLAGIVLALHLAFSPNWSLAHANSLPGKGSPREYEVKAVYLYNFLQFVNWPAGPCKTEGGRVEKIAVIGDSPIGESLQALQAELKRTQGVEISVHYYGPYVEGMEISGCQLVFIAKAEMKNIGKILTSLKGAQALTVSDFEECLDQGCMIALLAQANNIRWSVNRKSVDESGLRMNARLLNMAVRVVE